MTLSIAILANKNLHRVSQLIAMLAKQDVNICVHIDANADAQNFRMIKSQHRNKKNVFFSSRNECEWGGFTLVDAELRMCSDILERWPDTSHVQLISGDSLPVRPMSELSAMLANNPNVDFIESVLVNQNNWITGGLGIERFTLYFPFCWKTQRRRFDTAVNIQRKLGVKREMPKGLQPYIGSQWWCLTKETIQAILDDPEKPEYDSYFKSCWIPDESYFQTLVRKHSRKIQSRSLMFSIFDHQGKPATLYNDHAGLLGGIDEFFARKIWNGADQLYKKCANFALESSQSTNLNTEIRLANDKRKTGRHGLRMQGRAPNRWHEPQPATATPYYLFTGASATFLDFDEWLEKRTKVHPHGRLFAKSAAHFRDATDVGPGGLSSNAKIRDAAPEDFLINLVWESRNSGVAFHYEPSDSIKTETFFAGDPNAYIYHIEHAWILCLMAEGIENPQLLHSKAAYLAGRERVFLSKIQNNNARCSANLWTLGEVFGNPVSILSRIVEDIGSKTISGPMIMPTIADADEGLKFAQKLKDIGIHVDLDKIEPTIISGQSINERIANQ